MSKIKSNASECAMAESVTIFPVDGNAAERPNPVEIGNKNRRGTKADATA